MTTDFTDDVLVPPEGHLDLRRHLGLKDSERLRVSFIPGPGDLEGTFSHWQAKQHEPRIPIIAYSLMFYELMHRLEATCQVISLDPISTPDKKRDDQFHFEQLCPIPWKGRWSYFFSQYLFSRALISKVRSFNPHIVITSTHNPTISWRKISKGRKLVLTAHNTFWPKGQSQRGLKKLLYKRLLHFNATSLDGAICTSNECARQVSEVTDGKVKSEVACPQIVKTYNIEERQEARKLLFLGRIEESKGIFQLLDVFELLAKRYLDLTLVIAGEGSAQPQLKSRVRNSLYAKRITFTGRLTSDGVHAAIAATDLVICPTMTSFNEGLAVVGFEAAAHGIPTVLSSVVPAAELLGGSCSVYEADNVEELQSAIASLLEQPEIYQTLCRETAEVRKLIYDRSLSWGSGLYRSLISF